MDEKEQPLNTIVEALDRVSYKKQLKCNYIGNLTGLYDVKKLGKIYMPEIPKRQDWVLWLKAIEKGQKNQVFFWKLLKVLLILLVIF